MRKIVLFFILLTIFSFCDNNGEEKKVKFQGLAEGTYYAITYFDKNGINYHKEIDSLLNKFESSASIYIPNSLISRINQNDTSVRADKILIDIFNKSIQISKQTNGAFDITVAPLVNAWGFGFTSRMKVDSNIIDSLLKFVNYKSVRLNRNKIIKDNPGTQLDLNAIAKGYSVDLVGKYLEIKGIKNYLVDIGGEVYAKGKKPDGELWKIGIEKPAKTMYDDRKVETIIHLKNKAVATSGSYRKYYEKNNVRYSHTIDPKTGYPVKHSLLSASVMADNCITADGYATAFMVMGLNKSKVFLSHHKALDAYFIYSDKKGKLKVYYSIGFKDIIEKKNKLAFNKFKLSRLRQ